MTPPDQHDQDGNPLASAGEAPEPFAERYEKALADDRQRAGLLRFQRHWRGQRDASFARYEEDTGRSFEAMRDRLAAVKDEVIADRPIPTSHSSRRRPNGTARSSTRARAPKTPTATSPSSAPRHGVQIVDKSKSMVSEETGLNHYLEERGIRVAETDLGEWLVQLAHERPSHIIAPGDPHGPAQSRPSCSARRPASR